MYVRDVSIKDSQCLNPLTAMPQSGRLQVPAHAAALELKAQGLLNSRDLQLVQAYVSHKFQVLNFYYRVVRIKIIWITCRGQFGSTVPDQTA